MGHAQALAAPAQRRVLQGKKPYGIIAAFGG